MAGVPSCRILLVIFAFCLLENYIGLAEGSRPGSATNTHSCGNIRTVPRHLRSASHMRPSGLGQFYQKYTEAYGIPILGSRSLSDDAMKRACYVVRFLMADRADVRQSYYRKYGRFALMGEREVTTDIPEHRSLGAWWNQRARGLGATEYRPVSTGGEENALCRRSDRYSNEDIVLHEFSHGVHILGANFAIRGFNSRIIGLYNRAKRTSLWSNTYAMSTDKEYFAEGVQSYFNANAYANPPNGIHNSVNTRSKLRSYDPALYNMVREMLPCGNDFISRCPIGGRTTAQIRQLELSQNLRMDCNGGGGGTGGGGTGTGGGGTGTGGGGTGGGSSCVDKNQYCGYWSRNNYCGRDYLKKNCKKSCNLCGGGGGTGGNCKDDNPTCPSWASSGECRINPSYMLVSCKKSCNKCPGMTFPALTDEDCHDSNGHCRYWESIGECESNPNFMLDNCKKSCRTCLSFYEGSSEETSTETDGDVDLVKEVGLPEIVGGIPETWQPDTDADIDPRTWPQPSDEASAVSEAEYMGAERFYYLDN